MALDATADWESRAAELEAKNTHLRTLLRKSHAATKARDDELETWRRTAAAAAARADVAQDHESEGAAAAAACASAALAESARLEAELRESRLRVAEVEESFAKYKLRAKQILKQHQQQQRRGVEEEGGPESSSSSNTNNNVEDAERRAAEACAEAAVAAAAAAGRAFQAAAAARAAAAAAEAAELERTRGALEESRDRERKLAHAVEDALEAAAAKTDLEALKAALLTLVTTEDEADRVEQVGRITDLLGLSPEESAHVQLAFDGDADDDDLPQSTLSRLINAELPIPFFGRR